MIRFDDEARTLELGVGDLVEAGPPRGDLRLDATAPLVRARAGQRVHRDWRGLRERERADYAAEVPVRHRRAVRGWTATVSGRIDGAVVEDGVLVVEEVKSTLRPAAALAGASPGDFPAWTRQLQVYLHLVALGAAPGLPAAGRLAGRLVLVSLADGSVHRLPVGPDPGIDDWIAAQLDWIVVERERALARAALRRSAPVPFAHDRWRPGQRALAAEVERRLRAGERVLVTAPTGAGKTAAVLHAALRAAAPAGLGVFVGTARTPQQRVAASTLRAMARRGMPLRAVVLSARERVCPNEVVLCRPDACERAAGHHDRVREADLVERAWEAAPDGVLDADAIAPLADAHRACPHALAAEAARGADVVVGDINYLFDPGVRLAALAREPDRWIAVVDEVHGLAERAMDALSPDLTPDLARRAAEAVAGPGWPAHREWAEALRALVDDHFPEEGALVEPADGAVAGALLRDLRALEGRFEELAVERVLARPGPGDPWLEAGRAVRRARAALERAGEETVVIGEAGRGLRLLCRDPSGLLGPVLGGLAAFAGMSATLEPPGFHAALLGIEGARVVRGEAPFPPEALRVLVVPSVSTEYRHRRRDRAATAAAVSEAVAAIRGNAAVFFPSFAFLEDLRPLLELGDRPVLVQRRGMGERTRARLLDAMGRGEGHVLLAVMGGIFGEGIDLPGRALRGVVVVGPALPPTGLDRKLLQAYYQERFGDGRRLAWLVPAARRVAQAGGRVVRGPGDRGAVVLVGRRFLRSDLRDLLPPWWRPERVAAVRAALAGFWDEEE